jgi:hypothetical protein
VFYHQDSPNAEPVLDEGQELRGPCPACGKPPDVKLIIEVVVCSRQDPERLDAFEAEAQAPGPEDGRR